MFSLVTCVLIYLCGGLTFIPLILLILYWKAPPAESPPVRNSKEHYELPDEHHGKKGWIRLSNQHGSNGHGGRAKSGFMSNNTQQTKRPKDQVYGVLKHGTLFVYESEQLQDCKLFIPVQDYTISIYPKGRRDHELFNKSTAVWLRPKNRRGRSTVSLALKENDEKHASHDIRRSKTDSEIETNGQAPYCSLDQDIFLTCNRSVDKEDWYLMLLAASDFTADPTDRPELTYDTHFDTQAMENLIAAVKDTREGMQTQWLNAILGRIFLGIHKTEKVQQYFENKLTRKARKIKRPSFLDEIHVQSVHVGHAFPFLTNPKLVSLAVDGSLDAEAHVDYAGGLCVNIETDFHWSYSTRMKPIRVHLVLSVTVKRLTGKIVFKIKPPPTNRVWWAFESTPALELEIKPIVSDKQIKLNMATNAIESKIREVISETLVLPNMDDLTFCDTDGRGGIFRDQAPDNDKDEADMVQSSGSESTEVPDAESTDIQEKTSPAHEKRPLKRAGSEKLGEQPALLEGTPLFKSSPELLERRPAETESITSVGSTDSSVTSSARRWSGVALRRKKGQKSLDSASTMSETPSIPEEATEERARETRSPGTREQSSTRKSLFSKISTFKNELSEEMRSANIDKKAGFYLKAETLWQKSKEVAARERERKREENRYGDLMHQQNNSSQSTSSLEDKTNAEHVSESIENEPQLQPSTEEAKQTALQSEEHSISSMDPLPIPVPEPVPNNVTNDDQPVVTTEETVPDEPVTSDTHMDEAVPEPEPQTQRENQEIHLAPPEIPPRPSSPPLSTPSKRQDAPVESREDSTTAKPPQRPPPPPPPPRRPRAPSAQDRELPPIPKSPPSPPLVVPQKPAEKPPLPPRTPAASHQQRHSTETTQDETL